MITSLQNNMIKEMTKLHQKKYRKQHQMFLVEGYHLYDEAKQANIIEYVFTTDPSITGDKVYQVSKPVLEKLANTKHPQGVVSVCRMPEPGPLSNKILLLDHIQDPGNLGTLFRSALAFGFDTIVLDDCVDEYNDKVLRSTQGALFSINIIHQSIRSFMDEHPIYTYIGTAMNATKLEDFKVPFNMGLILGNEGAGVATDLLDQTLLNITIPMHRTESLNVAVAGSIIMYHCRLD